VNRFDFFGHYECSIDIKHRTTLPKNLRESLGENFVIGVSMALDCVTLYPEPIWRAITDSLRDIPATDISAYQYAGIFRGFSFIGQKYDQQGRVVLPELLIQYVELAGPAVYVGNYDRIDIKNRDEVLRQSNDTRANVPGIMERVHRLTGEAMQIALKQANYMPEPQPEPPDDRPSQEAIGESQPQQDGAD